MVGKNHETEEPLGEKPTSQVAVMAVSVLDGLGVLRCGLGVLRCGLESVEADWAAFEADWAAFEADWGSFECCPMSWGKAAVR